MNAYLARVGCTLVCLACLVALSGCAGIGGGDRVDYGAIVASSDRSDADRQTDRRRKPELLLAFTGVRPGMKVLDMGAGAGYSTELLARASASTNARRNPS